ncbi:MAG: GlsB/YeaQ/YmgE family stress response membrane protein [Myxococcaceae bacterium]
MLMSLLWFVVVGLVCGAIARALFPGKHPMGLGATALLGMGGSLLGGLVGSILSGGLSSAAIRPAGWIFSVLGSLVLLYAISRRR